METAFTMLGASFTLVLLLMIALWVVYLFQRNGGIVDIGWGLGFLICAWAYFLLGDANFIKRLVITIMATIWAVRLTSHLYSRFRSPIEDPRYTEMRERMGGDPTNLLFLMMFIFQGFLIIVISTPFFIVGYGANLGWSHWEWLGIAFWLIGIAGESYADAELAAFTKDPANKGKVYKKGLWRLSRHPNYFFEVIVWIGFYLFALPAHGGAFAIIAPITVFFLVVRVSGIPLAEAQALQTKGDAYKEYQRTTNAFIPWFPKE